MGVDNVERAERDFAAAAANVRKGMGGKQGDASEKIYGQTYAVLVRLGLKPLLKAKYR